MIFLTLSLFDFLFLTPSYSLSLSRPPSPSVLSSCDCEQVEPRQEEISRMREHIKQMDEELAKYHQVQRCTHTALCCTDSSLNPFPPHSSCSRCPLLAFSKQSDESFSFFLPPSLFLSPLPCLFLHLCHPQHLTLHIRVNYTPSYCAIR